MLTSDPKVLGLAILLGVAPSLVWLWFWLKQEEKNPEPKGLITIVFIMGMISVIFVLPIQKFIQAHVSSYEWQIGLWASSEEIIKYLAVMAILYKSDHAEEAIDWPIYLMTAALGFAALENILFIIKPLSLGETTVGLMTGQLRFLGSTLLHVVASGALGAALGIAHHMKGWKKNWHFLVGLTFAIALHSVFNFFIMKNGGSDFLKVFAFLWVAAVVVMLLFEKVRRMN